jgi:predicted Zn-dependent protease
MRRRGGSIIRLLVGLAIAAFSIISYLGSQEYNPVTGENQYVSLTKQQEIALGLQSTPELIDQYGGLHPDASVQNRIDDIGFRLVNQSIAADRGWEFEFYVLGAPDTINAFALPGGQVFITSGLLSRLDDDEIAGVLSHEIVHVLARHGSQRLAKNELMNGLVGAVAVASDDAGAAQTAAVIGQLVNMSYSREDELESDSLGVCLMIDGGYDPEGMLEVMRVLASASGGARQPEFFSTHPNPDNRLQEIEDAIRNASENCPS